MSEHTAIVSWKRQTESFDLKHYNRAHEWDFTHGNVVSASAAPNYQGDVDRVDPEQAFVAALSSCHMLTFLAIASQQKFTIDYYEDHAVGILGKNSQGKMAITLVKLSPKIVFSGDKQPDAQTLHQLHEKAHQNCFIANSVNCQVDVAIN